MKQTLKYILERLVEMLKIAEGKYSITIALASGVIVFGTTFIANQNITIRVLSGASMVFALVSVIYGFVALLARTVRIKNKSREKHHDNLLFYKNIMRFDAETYVEAIKKSYNFPASYKPDGFDLDLAKTLIAQAKVIHLKFWYLNISLFFLMLSIALAVIMLLALGGL